MLIATTWEQTPYYDPTNPNQQVREAMVGTGGDRGYASFYWNQVPNQAQVMPLSGIFGDTPKTPAYAAMLPFAGIGLGVLAIGAVTYFLTRKKRSR